MSHPYISNVNHPAHSRNWVSDVESSTDDERSVTTPSRRPMPPLPMSKPSTPQTHSPALGQHRPYQIQSHRSRTSYDGYESPSRTYGSRALDGNTPQPASPAHRGYNPQDYAQVGRASSYQSPITYRPPEYSPATYRPYNPATYQDPAGQAHQRETRSPATTQSPVTASRQYLPPVPPKVPVANPAYPPQYHTLPPPPEIPSPALYKAYSPAHSRSQSRLYEAREDLQQLQNGDLSTPVTPSLSYRGSDAGEICSPISEHAESPALYMRSGNRGTGNNRIVAKQDQYASNDTYFTQYRPQHVDSAPFGNDQPGLARSRTTGRHPHARPLPAQPASNDDPFTEQLMRTGFEEERDGDGASGQYDAEQRAQARLYEELQREVMYESAATPSAYGDDSRYIQPDDPPTPHRSFRISSDDQGRTRTLSIIAHDMDYVDDPEADAGIAAMRADEDRDLRMQQRQMADQRMRASIDDLVPVDLSSIGGGADVSISYDDSTRIVVNDYQYGQRLQSHHRSASSRSSLPAEGRLNRNESGSSMLSYRGGMVNGLASSGVDFENNYQARLSFDEGDESAYFENQAQPGTDVEDECASGNATMIGRPLPPPPEGVSPYLDSGVAWEEQPAPRSDFPFPQPQQFTLVPAISANNFVARSTSLLSPQISPPITLPDRAKTDSDERKWQQWRSASSEWGTPDLDAAQAQSTVLTGLNLPILPTGRRFEPSKLTPRDFAECQEPWALSSLGSWLRSVASGDAKLKEETLAKALAGLFTYKVPNMGIAQAEDIATMVVTELRNASVLYREEEALHIEFGPGEASGVLYQLTSHGCYASKLHDPDSPGRCYSHSCQRTIKRIAMPEQGYEPEADWATFYGVTKESIEGISEKEIERQNILHEIIKLEHGYLKDLDLLRTLFRDGIRKANPPIISQKRLEPFLEKVFGKLEAVQHANKEYLLPQLLYRQKEQGPWIADFSDIFRNWIRKAKTAYIDYAANFPEARLLMKQEEQKNTEFSAFLERTRNNSQSRRLGWDGFLKAPTDRLQHIGLLLRTAHRKMGDNAGPAIAYEQLAIDEIHAVTQECDTKIAVQGPKAELVELNSRLILRDKMRDVVRLGLLDKSRELLLVGDLQRMGKNKMTWLETRGILLDNFLILAKTVSSRHLAGSSKIQTYDVSKMPIPMQLLELDSTDENPVIKSSVRGVTAITTTPSRPPTTASSVRSGISGFNSPQSSLHSTSTSDNALVRVSTPNGPGGTSDNVKILYPFRIKHLGSETYTLYASGPEDRQLWCNKIIEAKTKYAASQFKQGKEPFTLRVIADAAFAHDASTEHHKTVLIKGTSLRRAVDDVERQYADYDKPKPICRAKVNCATTFVQADKRQKTLIGTDYGVYLCETGSARDWARVLILEAVTQIAVLQEFNLLLLIANRALIAYHLDVVCPVNGERRSANSFQKAPQRVSGQKDVGFFTIGKLKDRTLIFYEQKEGLRSSMVKMIEPVLQRTSTAELKSFSLDPRLRPDNFYAITETFRVYDEFRLESECSHLSIFTSSIAVAAASDFKILNLDKKSPYTIPDPSAPHTTTMAERLKGLTPLGMFRLVSDPATTAGAAMSQFSSSTNSYTSPNGIDTTATEFILVYEQCAVFVNKYGEISRSVHMEFLGKAKAATLVAGMLVLVDSDFVEVRDAQNGKLRQIVAGRDVRCLDDGRDESGSQLRGGGSGAPGAGKRTVKIAMQHPEQERYQIVIELVPNLMN